VGTAEVTDFLKLEAQFLVGPEPFLKEAADRGLTLEGLNPPVQDHIFGDAAHHPVEITAIQSLNLLAHKLLQVGRRGLLSHRAPKYRPQRDKAAHAMPDREPEPRDWRSSLAPLALEEPRHLAHPDPESFQEHDEHCPSLMGARRGPLQDHGARAASGSSSARGGARSCRRLGETDGTPRAECDGLVA
jgi:hypothetical protein